MKNRELYDGLKEFLEDEGFHWVLDQFEAELEEGQVSVAKINTLAPQDSRQGRLDSEVEYKKGQSAEFLKRSEYSDDAALILLLEAARRAIIDPTLMLENIGKQLSELEVSTIQFCSESGEETDLIDLNVNGLEPSGPLNYLARFDEFVSSLR